MSHLLGDCKSFKLPKIRYQKTALKNYFKPVRIKLQR